MAKQSEKSSSFNVVAGLIALCLIVAAALTYWQSGNKGAAAPELAALSQAIPLQAANALNGVDGASDTLNEAVLKVADLRRGGSPGRASDWQQLESRAAAIVANRSAVESVQVARQQMEGDATTILQLSDELLERSGSAAVIQEFQQRADRIRTTAATLPQEGIAGAISIAADVVFLRNVYDALAGEATELDVAALSSADSAAALAPMASSLDGLEQQSAALGTHIEAYSSLATTQAELNSSASRLLDNAFAGPSANPGSGIPGLVWLPLGALALALLLLAGLFVMHRRTAAFEQTARKHAEQNERNQQAILRLLDEMGSLADGDLTVEATVTEDITGTIADSFNYAIEELRTLVATVNETALMVDTSTKQTENTASHLAEAADRQAQEINAATSSMNSMASSIEEVSGNAERSSDVARHSVEVAHKGGEAVRRTIDGMNAIRETIQETSKRIKRLGESSQEIGNIVELINDIAEQTNILALNASIQASMAGEAGRGFAVVADEVQRLAERSTNATKQIEVLVRTIQSDTNEAVVSMERSTTDVVGGALLAENAGAALDEIEQVSNQIASLVQNISSSARQQASSAADVTKRTTRLREIGDETGEATAATAASIANLSELATELRKTVERFTLPPEMMQATSLARDGADDAEPPSDAVANSQVRTG